MVIVITFVSIFFNKDNTKKEENKEFDDEENSLEEFLEVLKEESDKSEEIKKERK